MAYQSSNAVRCQLLVAERLAQHRRLTTSDLVELLSGETMEVDTDCCSCHKRDPEAAGHVTADPATCAACHRPPSNTAIRRAGDRLVELGLVLALREPSNTTWIWRGRGR